MTIIGFWYSLAGSVILIPHGPRAKEWAYAGLLVNYASAAASHLKVGDSAGALVVPVFFTTVLIVSWALRQPARRLVGPAM